MRENKALRTVLWLSILLDALIIAGLGAKLSSVGLKGFSAWLRHLHFVATSSANGETTLELRPDYGFTALVVTATLAAFALSFFVLRAFVRSRRAAQTSGNSYH